MNLHEYARDNRWHAKQRGTTGNPFDAPYTALEVAEAVRGIEQKIGIGGMLYVFGF